MWYICDILKLRVVGLLKYYTVGFEIRNYLSSIKIPKSTRKYPCTFTQLCVCAGMRAFEVSKLKLLMAVGQGVFFSPHSLKVCLDLFLQV